MTRDGTFLVEGGRIVGPCRTCATRRATSTRCAARSRSAESADAQGFLGGGRRPAVRIESWTFTGATEH
jgi:hypothetical protein